MALLLNALPAISLRLLIPYVGVPIADVGFDLGATDAQPTAACVLTIGTETMIGTIDPRGSGRSGASGRARVLGGGGGWDKPLPPRHFHNDAAVLSTTVLQTTATEAGEQVTDVAPAKLAVDYVRPAGAASSVLTALAKNGWYVDLATGVTIVGSHMSVPADPSVEILSWDPQTLSAELASDGIVLPGTTLTDSRFDGTMTIRDVEMTFDASGSRAKVWCASAAATRLAGALANFVREKSGVTTARTYQYRVVSQGPDGRVTLQAVTKSAGVPDMQAIPIWGGIPGLAAKLELGSIVHVEFTDGDPQQPKVTGFDGATAIEIDLATALLKIGSGAGPVLVAGPTAALWFQQVTAALIALVPGSITATPPNASTKTFTD